MAQSLLAEQPVDLVISDMRMPEMDGAAFLELVRERWPDTIRLLLTGYSDVTSILADIHGWLTDHRQALEPILGA